MLKRNNPPEYYKNILLRRSGALGDVILTTPIVRRLARENSLCHINFVTACPHVFDGMPIVQAGHEKLDTSDFTLSVDLDMVYERDPTKHIVDTYMQAVFGDDGLPEDKQQILFRKEIPVFSERNPVFVHAAKSWVSRTIPKHTWSRACLELSKRGFTPIAVGTTRDMLPQWCVDMRDKFSIGQLASLFDQGACFLGADSSLLHVAGATFIPIAGVFTSVLPEYRLPYRNGELGKNCIGIQPALACVGCQGRHPPPRTTELCSRGDYACASMVEAEQMIEAVLKLTGK